MLFHFNIMNFKIERLDKRHSAWGIYKYRLHFSAVPGKVSTKYQDFHEFRIWAWDTFGPGCERELYSVTAISFKNYREFSPVWGWHFDGRDNSTYIYLVGDAELSMVQLKWNS